MKRLLSVMLGGPALRRAADALAIFQFRNDGTLLVNVENPSISGEQMICHAGEAGMRVRFRFEYKN